MKTMIIFIILVSSFSSYGMSQFDCKKIIDRVKVTSPKGLTIEQEAEMMTLCMDPKRVAAFNAVLLVNKDIFPQGNGVVARHFRSNSFALGAALNDNHEDVGNRDEGESKPEDDKKCAATTTEACDSEKVVPKDFSDYLVSFRKFVFFGKSEEKTPAQCKCIKDNLMTTMSAKDLKKEKDRTREELQKKILAAYSKKFLNDFSTNLEDASFFLTKNRQIFTDDEKAKTIQCKDPAAFDKKIEETCRARGISSQRLINKRKNFFINSLDKGNKPFDERIVSMAEEVLLLPVTGKGAVPGNVYTRYEYDNMRLGLAHNDVGTAVDHVIQKLILSPAFLTKIIPALRTGSPAFIINKLVADKIEHNPAFFTEIGIDKEIAGDILNDKEKFKKGLSYLMNSHPGFLNAMEKPQVFESLSKAVSQDNDISVLDALETKHEILEPILFERCEAMKTSFANMVCTEEEDLISRVNPGDLNKLYHEGMTPEEIKKQSQVHELLICEEKDKVTDKEYGLSQLGNPNFPVRKADFLERLTEKDLTKHQNLFTQSMLKNSEEEEYAEEAAVAANAGRAIGKSVSAGGVVSATVFAQAAAEGKAVALGEPSMTKEQAKTYLAESKKYDERQAGGSNYSNIARAQNNSSSQSTDSSSVSSIPGNVQSAVPGVVTPVPNYVSTPAKDDLNRYLSRNYGAEEVKKSLSDLDNTDVEELNRIKHQDSSFLAETLREETKRMENLQTKIEELRGKMQETSNSPVAKTVTPVRAPASDSEDDEPVREASRTEVRKSIASQVVPGNISSPLRSADSSGSSAVSSAIEAKKSVDVAQTPSGLVITKSEPVRNAQEAEVINNEMQKLLDSKDLDAVAIQDLKSKGMVFKYKVMENNKLVEKEIIVKFSDLNDSLRQKIEFKIAQKQRDNQFSKLAVLRMIMNQKAQ